MLLVKVAVLYPERVREVEVLAVLPFGRKPLIVELGMMVVQGRAIAQTRPVVGFVYLNDKNYKMLIAIAAVTLLVEPE